jgi:putative membrane protein insertion efficiency factor
MIKNLLICIIKFYQFFISPLLGYNCRFEPTCSEYAKDSIINHGILKGIGLTLWRIIRCHPFCKGGYDPVKVNTNDQLQIK